MAFTNVGFISLSCWCEFKGDRCGLFVVFEYYFSDMFNIPHEGSFILHVVEGVEINKHFLTSTFFLYFSTVVVTGSLEVVALGSGGIFVSSVNRRVLTVLLFILSVEISMVSRLDGCGVIVRFCWNLGYLLTSILVLISAEDF